MARPSGQVIDAINLQKKKLGPLSGVVTAALIRTNATLTSLNLSYNSVGAAGASALVEAVAFNTALQQLDLRHNRLDTDAKAAVRSIAPLAVAGRLLLSTPDSDRGDAEPTGAAADANARPGLGAKSATVAVVKTARPGKVVATTARASSAAALTTALGAGAGTGGASLNKVATLGRMPTNKTQRARI